MLLLRDNSGKCHSVEVGSVEVGSVEGGSGSGVDGGGTLDDGGGTSNDLLCKHRPHLQLIVSQDN